MVKTPPEIANGIDARIVLVRGHKAILDRDLAGLYGVPVRSLNQAVTRNLDRFPEDFMIQLRWEEMESLRSQIVILDRGPERSARRGMHLKYPPRAFTEQGVAMLSSVLRSKRAVRVNIEIMRAFVRLRALLASNADLARKLAALEKKYDAQFKAVFDAIRELMAPPEAKPRRRIGFISGD
jgi:ORF6N domain-containing protein